MGCTSASVAATPAAAGGNLSTEAPTPADNSLAVPKTGVAVWWLRHFAEENARALLGKSTSAACCELVTPATRELACAYVDLPQMRALRDGVGLPAVGPASTFVSHAWINSSLEFLAAVEASLGAAPPCSSGWRPPPGAVPFSRL